MVSHTWSAFSEQIRGMDPPRSVDPCTELQDSGLVHCIPQSNKSTSHAPGGRTWSPRFPHLTCTATAILSEHANNRASTFRVGQVHAANNGTHLSPHQAHVVTAQATLCRSSIREQQSWILRFGSHVASQAHSACSMCSATLLFPHPNPRRSSERLLSLSLQKLFTEPPWPSLCPVLSAWHWPWVWHSWPSTRQRSQRSRNLSGISHSPKHGAGRGPPAHKLK